MSYIVTSHWLNKRLADNQISIIDVRFQMNAPEAGRGLYLEGHIPHAIYLDLNENLSGPVQKHGGNHPLPKIEELSQLLSENGVSHNKTVVIYDEGDCMFASRAWWLLHYLGHKDVYVLEGGFSSWKEAEYPISDEVSESVAATFTPQVLPNAVANIEDVKVRKDKPSTLLIDSRSPERYKGEIEPLYDKSGHIPGAKNYFWKDVFHHDGTWKNTKELEFLFSDVPRDTEIIVSCGSGVSACPNIIALKTIGFENVKLYPGSFSDWISYPENELETKE